MKQTITGLFDSYDAARSAVEQLEAEGVPHSDISLVANHGEGAADDRVRESDTGEDAAKGAGIGAVIGGAGGLLAGLGMLAIPGIGPVVAAGWLASTAAGALTGGAVGGAAGGLIGALTDSGVPENEANVYAEGVRRGGTLVSARVNDEQASATRAILQRNNVVDPVQRGETYRKAGWSRFDPEASPYTPAEIERERASYR
ncbi:general stress protein [Chelatococcus reniformis]|nr:general stress protein [Chelatococcus reniformis]